MAIEQSGLRHCLGSATVACMRKPCVGDAVQTRKEVDDLPSLHRWRGDPSTLGHEPIIDHHVSRANHLGRRFAMTRRLKQVGRALVYEHLDKLGSGIEKKGTPASPPTARASSVLPVPGGPTSRIPLGTRAPIQAGTATSTRRRGELNACNIIRIDRPCISVECLNCIVNAPRSRSERSSSFGTRRMAGCGSPKTGSWMSHRRMTSDPPRRGRFRLRRRAPMNSSTAC